MLIYNYRSQDRPHTAASPCRRHRKVSWEFIARILVLATTRGKWKWKSLKMCRIYIYTIFMHAHTSYSLLADCVKVKKCAIIHEICDLSGTRYLPSSQEDLPNSAFFVCSRLSAAISAINCRVWTYFWPFCQFSATHHATCMHVLRPSPSPNPHQRQTRQSALLTPWDAPAAAFQLHSV